MTEWVLIIWVTVGGTLGSAVSDPTEIGTFRMEDDCWKAAEVATEERLGDKRGAVAATCVPRNK